MVADSDSECDDTAGDHGSSRHCAKHAGREAAALSEARYIRSVGVWLKGVYEDAERSSRFEIRWPSVAQIQEQIDVPGGVARLVVAVGSGTTLLGLLRGLRYRSEVTPILGVMVGSDPSVELDKYAPYWREQTTLKRSPVPYHSLAKRTERFGIWFHPHYEAKCLPYLQRGDCLVVVDIRPRRTLAPPLGPVSTIISDL